LTALSKTNITDDATYKYLNVLILHGMHK